jgi:hypothetical protein
VRIFLKLEILGDSQWEGNMEDLGPMRRNANCEIGSEEGIRVKELLLTCRLQGIALRVRYAWTMGSRDYFCIFIRLVKVRGVIYPSGCSFLTRNCNN